MPAPDALIEPTVRTIVLQHSQELATTFQRSVARLEDEEVILNRHGMPTDDDRCQRPRSIAGSGGAAHGYERRDKSSATEPPSFRNVYIEPTPWREEACKDVWMPAAKLLVPMWNDWSDMYVESVPHALVGDSHSRLPPNDWARLLRRADYHSQDEYIHIGPCVEHADDLH